MISSAEQKQRAAAVTATARRMGIYTVNYLTVVYMKYL